MTTLPTRPPLRRGSPQTSDPADLATVGRRRPGCLAAVALHRRYDRRHGDHHRLAIPYSASAAHLYGAITAAVRNSGRSPRPRRIDLMLASVATDLGAVLLTRRPTEFAGPGAIVPVLAVR